MIMLNQLYVYSPFHIKLHVLSVKKYYFNCMTMQIELSLLEYYLNFNPAYSVTSDYNCCI